MSSQNSFSKPTPKNGERYTLLSETELRLEIPQHTTVVITLLSGSAEIFGSELTLLTNTTSTKITKQSHVINGHAKFAIFTWHGCTIDVDVEFGKSLDISYTSDETVCNVVYVNTHAQLEAMRDEALASQMDPSKDASPPPRVLVVGPRDSGKTSLVKVLTSYAVKLGRTPILVDLDVSQNMLSIPGTIAASPMTLENISPPTNASSASLLPNTNPLVFWYGSTDLSTNPDLYKSFLDKMGECIDARLANDANNAASNANMNANPQDNNANDAKSSGIIVNGCGWIEDMGYELMKHTIQALNINVVLVMGHDRLYSMLSTHYNKMKESIQKGNNSFDGATTAMPKVIKLARSGGIVSRDSSFRRISRTLAMKQYFFGESIVPPSTYLNNASSAPTMMGGGLGVGVGSTADGMSIPTESLVHQYSPLRLDLSFTDVKIYKISNVTLSSSMLPVSAKQSSEAVQLTQVTDISAAIKSCMLAVCHPAAVDKYEQSGEASDLYMAGVPGFVVVDKVDMNREMISLLSPCAGSLASTTLLLADITWRE